MLLSSREPAVSAVSLEQRGRPGGGRGSSRRRASPGRRALRYVWAAPASLVGLLLVPFFDRRYLVRGAFLAEGARWPGRLGWRYRAITFGHVVLAIDELDAVTLAHELRHVRQYERWGALFFLAYAVASFRARLGGGHFYRDNAFELEARRADDPGL